MAIHIRSEDGRVTIDADDGSTVKDIYVDGVEVSGRRSRRRPPALTGVLLLLLLVVVLGTLAFLARTAHGSPLECESIRDPDARHYCRAVSSHDANECELIKNADLRHQCRVLAGSKP